jgi:capsular polysaccharide export protein
MSAQDRIFLLLQGPHGPFFGQLADRLRAAGAVAWRAGFNRGDQFFWGRRPGYIAIRDARDSWPSRCAAILSERGISDVVLYGDTRPIHAEAVRQARARGLRIHVFEEGYLRPYWATYERGGTNGHSRLMEIRVQDMASALAAAPDHDPPVPAHWGDMRAHVFYGAVYHFWVLAANHGYPGFRPHRALSVAQEFRLYLRRLILMPYHAGLRTLTTLRVRHGGFRFHLVLLQLQHDASFQAHSPFGTMSEFLTLCLSAFSQGAAAADHLVFKAHPLEDGRAGIGRTLRAEARKLGISRRVHFLPGGKLAPLLDGAVSAVTVNSTAGQQALWRGLPLRTLGTAIYAKPGLVSPQELDDFFRAPQPPDAATYASFRRFLTETSQVPGGFYGRRNRKLLLTRCADLLLSPQDPYDRLLSSDAASGQQSGPNG